MHRVLDLGVERVAVAGIDVGREQLGEVTANERAQRLDFMLTHAPDLAADVAHLAQERIDLVQAGHLPCQCFSSSAWAARALRFSGPW